MANTEKIVVQVVVQGEKDLQKVGKTADKSTRSFGKMAAGVLGAVAAFKQINQLVSNSIRAFRDFEFQMAKVKAITGANRSEFLQLSKSAQELGRSTFFTAQQVAELQTNYGKLGFTTKEILDAQEATLQLATATDSDLARAAIVAGSAVRGFGLDASETQRVVDVMAVAFTSSALDIEKFQTSMTKVAPIAKSAGFSIEDTTAIMAQLADSGIEASIAGTSLRNILLKMQDPNSDLVKSFGKTIHSLDELVPALTEFSKEGGSLAEIMEVVDLRQAAAFEQMITSRQRTVELRDALKDANGAAEEMARIVGDTLEGALKRAESASQGFSIAFIDRFGEQLKNITDGFANFINKLTDFIDVPISEKLNEDRVEMNELFQTLQKTNISQEVRNKLITQLNLKYGEYLPNLVTEKTNNEELKRSQVEANAALLQKISIMAAEEKLLEISKRKLDNINEASKLQAELTNAQNKAGATSNIINSEANQSINQNIKDRMSQNLVVAGSSDRVTELTKNLKQNTEEGEKLTKEFNDMAASASKLGVDVDALLKSTELSTSGLNTNTETVIANTQAKKDNALETDFLSTVSNDYFNSLTEDVLNGTATIADQEQKLRDFQIELLENLLEDEQLTYEERVNLETSLNKIKLDNMNSEKNARQEQIDGVAQLGSQLITLAGEDKKMQSIKKAGIALSSAAAIANNIQALSEMSLGVASQSKLLFPANIIGMVTTLSTIVSLFANIKAMKSAFGNGGIIETFANGGMVQGKSHAQGGEKFAVGGRVVELEGGEAVINKRSTAMFRSQLSAMNSAGGGVKFADGGLLNMPSFNQQQFNALGQSQMMGAMGSSGKVVVVEADITDSQNSVSVIQSEATI